MPIYGFTCEACGHQFDRLQKLSDPDPRICPECGAGHVHRQVTAPWFRLAGKGWYETDFKDSHDKKHNLASSSDAPAPAPAPTPTPTPAPAAASAPTPAAPSPAAAPPSATP